MTEHRLACLVCQRVFVVSRSAGTPGRRPGFCSPGCAATRHREKGRSLARAAVKPSTRAGRLRICRNCNAEFLAPSPGSASPYCSAECVHAAQRRYGSPAEARRAEYLRRRARSRADAAVAELPFDAPEPQP